MNRAYTAEEFRKLIETLPKRFYVYTLLANGIPFYVGKGFRNSSGVRALAHLRNARYNDDEKSRFIRETLKNGQKITFVLELMCNSEETAFFHEQVMISDYGRRVDGGTLFNRATGGQGSQGFKATKATRRKMSRTRTGVPLSRSHCKAIGAGRRVSAKVKADIECRKIPVRVFGVEYSCRQAAADALNLKRGTLSYRLGRWPGYEELR